MEIALSHTAVAKRSAKKESAAINNCARRANEKHESEETLTATFGFAGYPRRHGPQIVENGVVFNLWAPSAKAVELLQDGLRSRL